MSKTRTPEQQLAALAALDEKDIDTGDIPEIESFEGAVRGRFYRPVKKPVTIRLDADVIAWFKQSNTRYQSAINDVLPSYMIATLKGRGSR